MRHLVTPRWRSINVVALILFAFATLNAFTFDTPFLPTYKNLLFNIALIIQIATLFFVNPTPEVGPLRGPPLSLVQIRVVAGVLVLTFILLFVNAHWLDPGFLAPYKKQISGAAFMVLGLFIVLYKDRFDELCDESHDANASDA